MGQYKNYKLSEEPTPIEQLVGPPKGAAIRKFVPWIVLVVVLGAAGILGIPKLISLISNARTERLEKAAEAEVTLPSREVRPAVPHPILEQPGAIWGKQLRRLLVNS